MKIHTFQFISYIILFIFSIHFSLSFFIGDSYNYTRILTNSIFSILIIYFVIKEKYLVMNIIYKYIFFLIFLLYPLFQIFISDYINTEIEKDQHILISITYLMIFFIIVFYSNSLKNIPLKRFLNTILSLNLISILSISIYFLLFYELIDLANIIDRFYSNIRFLNQLQTIFIPVILFYYSLAKNTKIKYSLLFLLIVNFNLIFYTTGRGTIYSITISVFLLSFIANKNIRKDFLTLLLTFIISFLVFQIISYYFDIKNLKELAETSSGGRIEIYKVFIPILSDSSYIFKAIGFASQDIAIYNFLHPHNIFLYQFLGGGLLFAIIYLIFMAIYFFKSLKKYLNKRNKIKLYLLFTFIALCIHSMVSGIYITPLSLILIIYFLIIFHKMFFIRKNSIQENNIKLITSSSIFLIFISITNIYYLYKTYKISLNERYSKKEIKEDYNNIRIKSPGIMLFDSKIIKKEL